VSRPPGQDPGARIPIRDLARYFLRLGALGFGGPVALCGQMEKELVQEKRWVTREEMLEGIAVCQSLPGPLAIQVGIFISYLRGGFWGAWAGGWAFILPNFILVAALGALYTRLGGLPAVTAIFYGVSPAVIALILHSCYRLAKLGMKDKLQWGIAAACLAVTVAVRAEVALLFLASGIMGAIVYGSFRRKQLRDAFGISLMAATPLGPAAVTSAGPAAGSILARLLLFFLKAGSLTFGSGLVIVPFLQNGLVQQTGWLDERQFLIAVAIGMISPGPVVITATFGLPRRRVLGLRRRHRRHFSSVVSPCAHRGACSRPSPRQPSGSGLRQGRVCGRHWNDSRGMRSAG